MHPVVEALCAMRGVSTIVAASVVASTGDLTRFESPRQLMAYFGLVPSERSSGGTVRRGAITKTGNNEVRRVLTQAAWAYRFPARVSRARMDAFCAGSTAVRLFGAFRLAAGARLALAEAKRRSASRQAIDRLSCSTAVTR